MQINFFKLNNGFNFEHFLVRYKFQLAVLVLIVSLMVIYSILSLVLSDGIGLPQMFQRTVTLNQEDVYFLNYGFEIRGDVLFAYDERAYISIDLSTLEDPIGRFRYVTVFVSGLSDPNSNIRVRAREQSRRFSGGYTTQFRISEGQNTILLPNNEWAGIEIRLGHRQHMSMVVDQIVLSSFPIVPRYFIPIFLMLALIISVVWYFIMFRGFGVWLSTHPVVLLVVIIVFQCLASLYYMEQKRGFHIDEFYSIAQANGQITAPRASLRHPHHEPDFHNTWQTSDYFWNFLTVQQGEQFDFVNLYHYFMRIQHAHPFYIMQLHFISSFFPNIWHNLMGIGINIFWMTMTSILLYKASVLIIKEPLLTLLPSAVWGFSSGAMSYIMFIRMYATVIFFFTAISYLGLLVVTKKTQCGLKFCCALGVVIFLGWLSNLTFVIFFGISATLLFIWLLYSEPVR